MKRKSVTRLLAVALSGAMLLSSSPVAYAMEEKQPLEETIIESEPLDADKESLYIDEEVNIESEDLLDNQEPVNDGNMDLSIDSTAVQQVDGAFCDEIIEEDNSEEEIFEEIIDGDLIDSIEYYEEGDSGNQDTITEEYGTYINGGNCGVEGDNLKWAIYDSNNDNLEDLLVISGIGKMRAYSDPNDAPWYGSRYRISEIVLQPGIESVGKYAFTYLPYVESIIIPDGVTCLSDRMVYECANLSYVRIPKTVETMADVFLYTPKLKTAGGIGSGCNIEFGWDDRIPEGAFEECDFLTEVIIPDNITSVGGCAFYGCSNLEHVSIPKNTLDFEYSVFDECDLLVSAGPANSGSNIEFAWQESIPANVFDSSSIRKIEIPDYITTIADLPCWKTGRLLNQRTRAKVWRRMLQNC